MNDPYHVLGVAQSATDDEVTQAYRKLAKKNHPDVNPGDKAAERRMQEINAAYTQIKEMRGGGPSSSGDAQSRYRGYGGSRGQGGYGGGSGEGPFGGWWDPFEDIFGQARRQQQQRQSQGQSQGQGGYGGWDWQGEWRENNGSWRQQWSQTRQEPSNQYVRAARECIMNGQYQQALNLLMALSERDAAWHYYCAIANAGIGNRVTAVRLARTAAEMEPGNADYQSLLNQFEQGGYAYKQAAAKQGFDIRSVGGVLMQCLLYQVLCFCCCRGC